MLIQITNTCSMNCPHCLQDSKPDPAHMSDQVFKNALRFSGVMSQVVVISGGEPTLHPNWKKMVEAACDKFSMVMLCSNASWLDTPVEDSIVDLLQTRPNLYVQLCALYLGCILILPG